MHLTSSWRLALFLTNLLRFLQYPDDSIDDMVDAFKNDFNKSDLYQLLSEESGNPKLRRDLNERYLSDFLNMVYSAQSDLEFQVNKARETFTSSRSEDFFCLP